MTGTSLPASLIFVDSRVADYQTLIENRPAGTDVVVLDASQDGVEQITNYLASRENVGSVHIVSHGAAGVLQLGATTLTGDNLERYTASLQSWSTALSDQADILLYGCDVAAGPEGSAFVQQLAQLTGADLAASVDLTGNAELGGNWTLEYATGEIDTSVAFRAEAIQGFNTVLSAFTSGNIVVVRVGDGTTYDLGTTVPVFLDEYTTAGILVQSIAMPTQDSGNQQTLTLPNTWPSDGYLGLSSNGRYLTLAGLDTEVSNLPTRQMPRVIALVDGAGSVDTTTWLTSTTVRSVITEDGTEFWTGGVRDGVRLVPYGSQGPSQQITDGTDVNSVVDIFDGQLYVTSDNQPFIAAIGTGVPTTLSTVQGLPGLENIFVPNTREFVFLDRTATVDGLDTLYVAGFDGIYKYAFNGATWLAQGNFSSPTGSADWRGLTGTLNGSNVDLYAVWGSDLGDTRLMRITDLAAFDQSFNGSSFTVATAASETAFRGVAFTPVPPTVTLQVLDALAQETGLDNTGQFRIRRTSLAGNLTVQLALAGTANAIDYTLSTGNIVSNVLTLVIPAGQEFLDVTLTATPDTLVEGNETLILTLNDINTYRIAPTPQTGTVTLVDNQRPVGVANSYTLAEDSSLTVPVDQGVLANDTDADGNTLQATVLNSVQSGQLTLNANGSFSYVPNANFNGSDRFTYQVSDGFGSMGPVTVTLNVTPVPDVPVAIADQYTLNEDTSLTVGLANGLLANDQDPDRAGLSVQLTRNVNQGRLTLQSNGSFTYIPAPNFNGEDSFTYRVRSAAGLFSDQVTVQLRVRSLEDAPVAVGDRYTLAQQGILQVNAANGVLRNDQDGENDPLTAQLVTGPGNGTLNFNSDGSFVYRPNAAFRGVDQFTYRANDGKANSQPTTVILNVTPINQPPHLRQLIDDQQAWEDRAFSVRLPANSFVDGDGDRLTYSARLSDGHLLPTWLRFNAATQQFTGTPRNPDVGTLRIRVFATDPSGEQSSDLFLLRVNNTNDAPRVSRAPTNYSALVGRRFSLRLAGNTFVDEDQGDRLSYQSQLANGRTLPAWLRFDPANLSFQGQAPVGSEGTYRVRLLARDRRGAIATSTFTLRVSSENIGHLPNPSNRIVGTEFNDSDSVRGTQAGDRINALGGNDYIRGFGGQDLLLGAAGHDVLDGGEGDDWLIGGTGNDTLFGNVGRDVFVLGQGEGVDWIADFQIGTDKIAVTGGLSFDNLRAVQGSSFTEIRLDSSGEVLARLSGIQASTIIRTDVISV